MLPLRLVIDTNVMISAALKPEGLQRTTFLLAITKPARLYVSQPILAEYAEVLSRPELKIRKGLRRQLLQLIRNRGNLVVPEREVQLLREVARAENDEISPRELSAQNDRNYFIRLTEKSLLVRVGRGRYKLYHPLFRLFLREG